MHTLQIFNHRNSIIGQIQPPQLRTAVKERRWNGSEIIAREREVGEACVGRESGCRNFTDVVETEMKFLYMIKRIYL